ncbi:MAG: hypothetical protein FWB76_07775 [Oscillospiraceae bacterium]|nr:hypothetical protein [Oscillospiraceae bacterium]
MKHKSYWHLSKQERAEVALGAWAKIWKRPVENVLNKKSINIGVKAALEESQKFHTELTELADQVAETKRLDEPSQCEYIDINLIEENIES